MTTEPKPKSLWDCIVFEPDPEEERHEMLKKARAEVRYLKAEIKRRAAKNTKYGKIMDISTKTTDLNFAILTKKGIRSIRILKKQHKEVERFSKKYLPKLKNIKLEEDDFLRVRKFETEIFILKLRYDVLMRYHEKILVGVKNDPS